MAVQRVQRQKLMFELLEAHPFMMASMLNWAAMRPGPLQRWSKYIWDIRFEPMETMFGHLWSDPNHPFCKAFEPVSDVCRQILDILTRVGEPIKTAAKQFIDPLNEALVTPAPATYPPLGEGEFDVNRDPKAEKDPDAAPAMPIQYIIAYFEQLLETAELEGAANRGELRAYDINHASWKTKPATTQYSPIVHSPVMHSPEPALTEPKPVLNSAPQLDLDPEAHPESTQQPQPSPYPLTMLRRRKKRHKESKHLVATTTATAAGTTVPPTVADCMRIVNGLMAHYDYDDIPPPDI